jgi:hypothetical protein
MPSDPTVSDGATFEEDVEAELVFHREALPARPGACVCGHTWPCLVLDIIAALRADRALIEAKNAEIRQAYTAANTAVVLALGRLQRGEQGAAMTGLRAASDRFERCADAGQFVPDAALEGSAPAVEADSERQCGNSFHHATGMGHCPQCGGTWRHRADTPVTEALEREHVPVPDSPTEGDELWQPSCPICGTPECGSDH